MEIRNLKLNEFRQRLKSELEALDHPEIVGVDDIAVPPGTSDDPNDKHKVHNQIRVRYASGANSVIMAHVVRGPGIPKHAPYSPPAEAF
ncbi:hypothetical protein SAMN05444320_10525 [Streptoalloteichus hindustanus]|uniref:Uncharacterized protein n=2 Tax=Streptoalloteichus hindustanus TaxID=2017 RepID=A0A1M5EKG7_STRHI|nr:hypothetical protein SAMN05444320_10525 [Streptoalloteichus hindustanus]